MLQIFALVLPVLVPSWKFFSGVGPSPRVEVLWHPTPDDPQPLWHELAPRPDRVAPAQMLRRLVYNPDWNEALFLVSLSERLVLDPTVHSITEIEARIRRRAPLGRQIARWHLVFVSREAGELVRDVLYLSEPEGATDGV